MIGTGLSEGMLQVARHRAGRNTKLFQSFDLVICARVLTHVDDAASALREIQRVLRPGGHAIVADVDGAHRYRHTRVPTPGGKVPVQTYKRGLPDLPGLCGARGLSTVRTCRLGARTVRWLPSRGMLHRLDRSGRTPVGCVCLLSATGAWGA